MKNFDIPADSLLLYSDAPAAVWEQAYPLGNGTIGAMVFGGTEKDRICLNHDTLWSGYPRKEQFIGKKEAYQKARELAKLGRYAESDKVLSDGFSSYGSEMYVPMGELDISYTDTKNEKVKDYSRTLDLSQALNSVSYLNGNSKMDIISFVSHPDRAFLYRASCKGSDFSCEISLSSVLYSRVYSEKTFLILEGECPLNSEQNMERTDRTKLYSDDPKDRCMRFMTVLSLKTDGTSVPHGSYLTVSHATYIELYLTCETSFNGFDKHPFLNGKEYKNASRKLMDSVFSKKFDDILRDHVKDYKEYFDRVGIDLGSEGLSKLPTVDRMKRFTDEKGNDPALIALLFNYGRYLTISGSRPGSQAMTLQGIWNPYLMPPWHSNYTVNINTEMNYFPTLATDLAEMYLPFIDLIKEVAENGRLTAWKLYGAPGWVCHHNTDIWRTTQPVAGMAVYSFWNASGGWFCHALYEYYEYTLDVDFLRDTAFPIMTEAALFYLSQLETLPDGSRAVFPSTSPENSYLTDEGETSVSETAEMTMAIVRELFKNIISSAKLLGIKNDTVDKIACELPKLYTAKIGSDGRLLEWYGEKKETEIHHRHTSHLYGLYPGNEFSPEKTPDIANACKRSLEARGDESTGWSLAWKTNFYARLNDGNHALSILKLQLHLSKSVGVKNSQEGGTYPNLLCAHPPFQIDGNFGATSGICEMLLRSDADTVSLLPACPDEWNDISVRGLRAKGGRTVSFSTENGKLTYCEISGPRPARVLFKNAPVTSKELISYIYLDDSRK